MFMRIVRDGGKQELLLNMNHISKIEVKYPGDGGWNIAPHEGANDPAAQRWYIVHVAGEVVNLQAKPGDPVCDVLEQIYRDALKS